jgi:hypothetical protein
MAHLPLKFELNATTTRFRIVILLVIAFAAGLALFAVVFDRTPAPPVTFVIDKRGAVVARMPGGRDFGKLDTLLEEKLKEPT